MQYRIDKCSNSDYSKLARALTNFNLSQLPDGTPADYELIGYVIREDLKGLVGGITGKILLGTCLSIDILWVDEVDRDQGYGKLLLQTIEENAKALGSHLSVVDTFDFQALEFYKSREYRVFGELADCPCPGNTRYYLSKKL